MGTGPDGPKPGKEAIALAANITPAVTGTVAPVAGFRFGVLVEGDVVGWFTECNGLSVERGVLAKEEGGLNAYVHQLPNRITYPKITLKRGMADLELWKWFREGLYDLKIKRRPVSILLYSGDRQSIQRWDLKDAFPTKWSGPDLKADSNQVAIETLELVHHGFEMSDWTGV